MPDRPNVVFIGKVTDQDGFPAELLEEPLTGRSFLAYDVETYFERAEHLQRQEARGKRPPGTAPRVNRVDYPAK